MIKYSSDQDIMLRDKRLHILVTEDHAQDASKLRWILEQDEERKYSIVHCNNLKQTLAELRCQEFDLLLLELDLEETSGIETLTTITKDNPAIPIIALTAGFNDEQGKQAIQAGAEDYLPKKDLHPALLSRAILYAIERHTLVRKLQLQATTDSLTGLPNRNALFQRLELAINSGKRHSNKFAVALLGLDGFKAVNDDHGHSVGDELLRQVGVRLTKELRSSDFIARLGGDEFVIVLQHYNGTQELIKVLEKKRSHLIQPLCIPTDKETINLKVSASIGVVEWNQSASPQEMLTFADKAMGLSKQKGHNMLSLGKL
ncbi:GGDEF domain-containing response regulator [Teredinibacter franksiae]|uniref:GGDEF domain-containing response regulator n=1 Tax=Teredinibacter franksiae TaxID=2761453 RepID=UPI0016261FA6|nr:diguanylate cyclase [Teredinibacter franksiae]